MIRETCHVARDADGEAPYRSRPSASAPRPPAASATAETGRYGWRPPSGRTPRRRNPHPGTTPRVCPSRDPGPPSLPALSDLGDGPWAAANAEATAALRRGAGVPSEAAVDTSSAASGKTLARWRRRAVSAAGRDNPWVAAPLTPCRLSPDPPAAVGGSRDQWSPVERCHWARDSFSGVTPNALCKSRRCRSSSSSDSASTDRLEPGPVGIPPAAVPDELPTASKRGGPEGGAPSWSCPSRGEG